MINNIVLGHTLGFQDALLRTLDENNVLVGETQEFWEPYVAAAPGGVVFCRYPILRRGDLACWQRFAQADLLIISVAQLIHGQYDHRRFNYDCATPTVLWWQESGRQTDALGPAGFPLLINAPEARELGDFLCHNLVYGDEAQRELVSLCLRARNEYRTPRQ